METLLSYQIQLLDVSEITPLELPTFATGGFLFNEWTHLCRQPNGPVSLLLLVDPRSGMLKARCAIFRQGSLAISPAAAPFGSIEFTNDLSPHEIDRLVSVLCDSARQLGCTQLQLSNYPVCYAPQQAQLLSQVLLRHGFHISRTTDTFYLTVQAEAFDERLAAQEKRRLRKARKAGLAPSRWLPPCPHTVAHFYKASRHDYGYDLTIRPETLIQLLLELPDQFPVFIVQDGAVIAALCVCVRVRYDILYAFLPVTHPDYRSLSPMVMLTDHLYEYCQQEGIRILDLGTALDGQQRFKASLARFKQNVGAITSPKLTFKLELV